MKKSRRDSNGVSISLPSLIKLRGQAEAIHLPNQKKVFTQMAGGYVSGFRGRGVDFAEVRNYEPGDDIRHMEWRVTARTGKPHTKLFREERERQIIFAVDYGPSMFFGTRTAFKSVIAAKITALLAWAAVKQGERVGGMVFTGTQTIEIRPQARQQGILPLLKALADTTRPHAVDITNYAFAEVLTKLRQIICPGSLIFLLSDFLNLTDQALHQLSQLVQHNQVIACFIYDQLEKEPPPPNHYIVSNGQSNLTIDTTDKTFCFHYRKQFSQRHAALKKALLQRNIPLLEFATHEPIFENLINQFGIKIKYG